MLKQGVIKRKKLRLPDYDYSQEGWYFVTICVKDRKCLFGEVVNGEMVLNEVGKIVDREWNKTSEIRKNVSLDVCIVMPNHIHGIIIIESQNVGVCRWQTRTKRGLESQSIGSLINHFKSACTKQIKIFFPEKFEQPLETIWQRNYYEHVIRNEKSLNEIQNYILNNPLKWEYDKENPARKSNKQGLPAANPYNVTL